MTQREKRLWSIGTRYEGAIHGHNSLVGHSLKPFMITFTILLISSVAVADPPEPGADGVIKAINENASSALEAFQQDDAEAFAASLQLLKANLQNATTAAAAIVGERESNPDYVPVPLNPLPVQLTESYYKQTVPAQEKKLLEITDQLVAAEQALKKSQYKASLTILLVAIQTFKDSVETVSTNPLTVVMGAKETLENAKKNATYISDKVQVTNDIKKAIADIRKEKAKVEEELETSKKRWEKAKELKPVIEEISIRFDIVQTYIDSGEDLPIVESQSDSFWAPPYVARLSAIEQALGLGTMAWADGTQLGDSTFDDASADFLSLSNPGEDDEEQWLLFLAAWEDFLSVLLAARAGDIATAMALGEEWRHASEADVLAYLEEAFLAHGAPLVLKHDGGKIFHGANVRALLERFGVESLTGPRHYPQYNGRRERAFRDLRSFDRALRRHAPYRPLEERLRIALEDLNHERPRPCLNGRTAAEVLHEKKPLVDRKRFQEEVQSTYKKFKEEARLPSQQTSARRRAVEAVLLRIGYLEITGEMPTDFHPGNAT